MHEEHKVVLLAFDDTATDGEGNVTKLEMPATSNVLQWFTEDGTKVSVRPSGTEPKIKFYMEAPADMASAAAYPAACEAGMAKVKAVCKDLGI